MSCGEPIMSRSCGYTSTGPVRSSDVASRPSSRRAFGRGDVDVDLEPGEQEQNRPGWVPAAATS